MGGSASGRARRLKVRWPAHWPRLAYALIIRRALGASSSDLKVRCAQQTPQLSVAPTPPRSTPLASRARRFKAAYPRLRIAAGPLTDAGRAPSSRGGPQGPGVLPVHPSQGPVLTTTQPAQPVSSREPRGTSDESSPRNRKKRKAPRRKLRGLFRFWGCSERRPLAEAHVAVTGCGGRS